MKFTKKAFTEWLNSKRDRESVGYPEDIRKCPLCEFLKSQGAESVSMRIHGRTVNGVWHSNPRWATLFQESVCAYVDTDDRRYITAKTAVAHLG